MIQSMFNMMMLIMTFLFLKLKHPLAMGFLILFQTLLICAFTGTIYESFWFSYILFLIFLGGLLVLFIYVTSLASNEMFNLSMKLVFIMLLMMLMLLFINMMIDNMEFTFINNNELKKNLDFFLIMKENLLSINKLYNYPTNLITLVLINYLFFTLIVVVKITNFFYGPLRNLN